MSAAQFFQYPFEFNQQAVALTGMILDKIMDPFRAGEQDQNVLVIFILDTKGFSFIDGRLKALYLMFFHKSA